jgi:amino acid adenylation domain-containing protein
MTEQVSTSTSETLADRWAEAVVAFRDQTALRDAGVNLTFGDLDARARVLAAHLIQDGLMPGRICGLHLERSVECVISMLAVTLTGAAWLPLDPNIPAPRLRLMVEDACITHLLCTRDTPSLGLEPSVRTRLVDRTETGFYEPGLEKHDRRANATDLAYVIYTSGSTGRPKGIEIEHGSLLTFLDAMRELLPEEALKLVFSLNSPSFDISILDVFLTLICGGTLALASHAESRDGRLLAARLETEQPTLIQATPATWRMLLASGWQGHEGLTLLTGGEAIPPPTAGELLDRADTVWNLYGPTEATIWATAARVSPVHVKDGAIPIGTPLAAVKTLILGESGNRIDDGMPGELYLLGPGLARGYVDDTVLTSEKFISLPEGRAYRTGDQVCLRADGQLYFLGRIDDQIKINSTRIEPAEVEAVIREHPEVHDTVVAAKTGGDGERRLVAYIVPQNFDPGQQRRRRLASHWQTIWSREYRETSSTIKDSTFNTAGLRSSYDDVLIDEAALRENVEETCRRIRALGPKNILDLGCGSGLLLFSLAPQCDRYVGVDFSSEAIAALKSETESRGLSCVQVLEQAVDEDTNIEAGSFDVVLLNTVIQYFPDTDYLASVLDNALRALRPGGTVFIGDVRELGSLDAFHGAVVQAKAADTDDMPTLRAEWRRIAERETELVFDPAWFEAFAATRPGVTSVETALKEGRFSNELVDFRYDIILRKGGSAIATAPNRIYEFDATDKSAGKLWDSLKEDPVDCVLLKNLLNARRRDAFHFLETLGIASEQGATERTPDLSRGLRYDPDLLSRQARARGYQVVLLPDPDGSGAHFAALLVRANPGVTIWSHRSPLHTNRRAPPRLSNELQQSLATTNRDHTGLIAELQSRMGTHLPAPMCPSHYVVLRELPITQSGKIDRRALPRPLSKRPALSAPFIAPRDALELQLTGMVEKVLGVSPVGAQDGFMELGGDSLATVELLLAIEETTGTTIEIGSFLAQSTVEGLAATINEKRGYRPTTALVSLKTGGTAPPLFFIHGAGGLAFTVFELGQALSSDRPIFAVQDPACDPDIEPARCVEDMAAALIGQIMTIQPIGPYYLCGHSFGGLLAYEMAIQLRACGQSIAFLGMLDTPTPPATAKEIGFVSRLNLFWRELRFLGQILSQAGPMALDGCYILFGAEARYHDTLKGTNNLLGILKGSWANFMFRYFHNRAGLASAVDRQSRLLMLRQPGIRRAIRLTGIHDAARRHYQPGPYDGPIVLLRAEEGSAETKGFPDETLGWNRLAPDIHLYRSPGTHFTMTRGKNIKYLASILDDTLNAASAN